MKRLIGVLLVLCIGAYACYWISAVDRVNRGNDKADIRYMSDSKDMVMDGIRYTVLKEEMLDAPSFYDRYPETATSIDSTSFSLPIEKGGGGRMKVLLVHMRFENTAKTAKTIDLMEYMFMAGAAYTGLDMSYLCAINQIQNTTVYIYGGASGELILPFTLSESMFTDEHFENADKLDVAIAMKGYPHRTYLTLHHIKNVASKDVDRFYEQYEECRKIKDTKKGQVLNRDKESIFEGVGHQLLDLQCVTNVKQYAEYDQKCMWPDSLAPDGSVIGEGNIKNDDQYMNYMVFVKMKIKNYTPITKQEYVAVSDLGYYRGNKYIGRSSYDYFKSSQKGAKTMDENDGKLEVGVTLAPGEEIECVTGVIVTVKKKEHFDPAKTDFYVQLSGYTEPKADPRKGRIKYANYCVTRPQ